jgi:hypothetical protein
MKRQFLAFVVILLGASPPVAIASTDDSNLIRDIYGEVVERTIIAGILIGENETTGEQSECEWSPSLPRDSGRDQTFGEEVEKTVGAIQFRLYDRSCPTEHTTYHWIAEVSTETIARNAASVAYDLIPAPFGEFAPPARQGLINIGTWFWVNTSVWQPKSVTAWVPTPAGPVTATTTATPYKIVFDPGDGRFGNGKKTCTGPGLQWSPIIGDYTPSPCMYTYRHSSAVDGSGFFSATLSIVWKITWRSNTGAVGTLPDVTTTSTHQMRIREFQALVTS